MQSSEYIFTALIIVAILIGSAILTSIMPQSALNVSEIEQLKMVAQKIMTQITLNSGDPPEWGSNITIGSNDLRAFGLAKHGWLTRGAYVLDPDKVQRLSSEIPSSLYIPPSRVIELLSLGHDYGIKLEFIPALNASISAQWISGEIYISVSVVSEQSIPIADANVTARVFYLQDGQINKTSLAANSTGIDGSCSIKFSNVNSNAALIVLLVDYHGICVVKTYLLGSPLESYFIGNHFILNNSINPANNIAYQVIALKSYENYTIDYVSCSLAPSSNGISNYNVYDLAFVEPYTVALLAVTDGGDLTVACKHVPPSYSSISGDVFPPLSYMLERSVTIGQSLYTLRLQIWRMSW
ncbi:hypothetical protein J7L29_04370 [Candidatus Bathyarchaeota archaeon]|nr:hypothetical protein [Candidatus Bathyarchaeota archaeon]